MGNIHPLIYGFIIQQPVCSEIITVIEILIPILDTAVIINAVKILYGQIVRILVNAFLEFILLHAFNRRI